MMKKILLSLILGTGIIVAGCGTRKVELPVDETAPTISINSPADNAIIQENSATVQGTVTDDGSGIKTVTVSGGGKSATATPDANGNFSAELTDLNEGSLNILAQASDEQGNTASASVKVLIDLSAPTVALLSPTAGQYLKGTVTLSASASDTNGVTQVEFLMDSSIIGADTTLPYSINYDTTSASNASHSFTARATDAAGKQATSTAVSVTVDNLAPTGVAVTSPANNAYVRQSITVTASASDNNSITLVEFLVDGGVFASDSSSPYSVQLDTTTLSNGAHTLSARATDIAGNQTTSATININVDNLAPTISITSPICGDNVCNATEAPGGFVATAITVTTNAENGQIVTLFSNGNPIGTGAVAGGSATITQGTALTEGSNNLVAGVSDVAGNSNTSSGVSVTLDTTLNIAIVFPSNGQWMNDTWDYDTVTPGLQLDVTVSTDAETGQTVTISGGDAPVSELVNNGAAIKGVTFSTEGIKNLTASVSDDAGNGPLSSGTVTVYYDITAPTVTITSPSQNQLYKSSCPGGTGPLCQSDDAPGSPLFQTTVQVSATDNLADLSGRTVNIYSNGNLVGTGTLSIGISPWTATVNVNLRDGGNALTASVSDPAGNTGTSSTVKTYTFVGQPGTISGEVYNRCTFTTISGATVELSLDPQYNTIIARTTTDGSGQFTLQNVPPGEYSNIRSCLDRDGNSRCEIKNGFGPDGQAGIAGVDDDGNGTTDDCVEYEWGSSDDTTVDFIGFYNFAVGNGPVQLRPGRNTNISIIYTWIGNSPSGGSCTIQGGIRDTDTSWAGVNTIIATLDYMGFGDESPVNLRSSTSVAASTIPQAFTLYEQPFAPSDGWSFIGAQFLLAAGKDLNGDGRLDVNSEPFTTLSPANCGNAGLSFTLQPRANIQGTVSGYTPGWVVVAGTFSQGGGGGAMSGSAADINPDGTYSLTVLGNSTYYVLANKDRDGFYLNNDNELSALASIFPLTVGTGTVGGVNISLPPVRTISGTISGSGISNWAISARAYNNSMKGWIEPTSNYYLLEVLPNQYWLNVFNDRNANLDPDPREGSQNYGSQVDVGTSSASGINITVTPDVRLRNVFINDPPAGGDNDRLAEPGETVGINVQFRNYRANATNVNATLSCITNCTGIIINSPNTINYANINFDELTTPSAYSVTIGGGVPDGTKVTFGINISSDGGGYTNYQEFSIIVSEGHRNGTPPGLPASGAAVATGTSPYDVAIAVLAPATQSAYVTNYNSSVTVLDALTNAVITTIGAPNITGCPSTVSASTAGTRVYVGNDCNGNVAVIDTTSNTVINTINVGSNAYGVAVSPDGTKLWVTNTLDYEVVIINTSSGSVDATIPLAGWPREITFSPDGEQVFVSNNQMVAVIGVQNRRIQGNIPNVWIPDELAVGPYSLYLYGFDWDGQMYQVDIDTYSYTQTNLGASVNNYGSLAITPDGALMYFTENQSSGDDKNVYVIDIPSKILIGSFTSGIGTNKNSSIAFTQAGDKCWVTNYNDNTARPAQ